MTDIMLAFLGYAIGYWQGAAYSRHPVVAHLLIFPMGILFGIVMIRASRRRGVSQ